ncbi:hypothetical protein ACIPSE_28140 [Streptomyces sp. NPDC090106]|uniref:hypothetical protein n=1 Tax=Streptomyces sp. NPDC090106 TaxID=3365946 RepID=UPI003812914D
MTEKPPKPAAPPPGPLAPPSNRRNRSSLIIVASAAAIIATIVATGIIVVQSRDNEGSPTSSVSRPTPSRALVSTADEEQVAPQETEPQIKGLQERAVYESGIAVSLSGYRRGTSTAIAAPANVPFVSFTVKIENKSASAVELGTAYLTCFHGDEIQESQQVFDENLHGLPDLRLRPGRTAKATVACEMPKDETYLQVEFTPSPLLTKTIFAGDVK